jgi:hypothetical protein
MKTAALGVLLALAAVQSRPGDSDWEIEGVWSDACPCDSFCPCWFNSPPTHGGCHAVSFFLIEKGRFGEISLAGTRFVEALSTPPGMTMIEASVKGQMRLHKFFLDSSAADGQQKALREIVRQAFDGKDVTVVPMKSEVTPRRHRVTIEPWLDYEVMLLTGLDGKNPVRLLNAPFTDRTVPELQAGKSVRVRYRLDGEAWDFSGRHATFARFLMNRAMYRPGARP